MSEQHKDPTTTLHLNKFAPGTPDSTPTAEQGVTVVVKRAAAQTVADDGTPVLPRDAGALPGKEMLGAVSYCYAKGVFQSEEIERKMMRDPALREALHGEVPDARAIRRFRALNRGAIQTTLEKAFSFLRRKEKAEMAQPLPGQPPTTLPSNAPGESTVIIARNEAEERVQRATFVDNMSKE